MLAIQQSDISDLLAFALFDVDERAQKLREPLHVFLVSLALFNLGRSATRADIEAAVASELPAGSALTTQQIEQAVSVAIKADLLKKGSGDTVELTDTRRTQLSEAGTRVADGCSVLHGHLRSSVEVELGEPLSTDEAEALRTALEVFFQRTFQERSVELSRSFGPDGNGFDETGAAIAPKSITAIAASVVTAAEPLRRAQVSVGLRTGLLSLPSEGQAYLAAVYQKTVAFALLEQDPSVRKVRRRLAAQRILYLDTNVLMALMFPAHSKHDVAEEVVGTAKQLGIPVRASKFTLDELALQINESAQHFEKLNLRGPALSVVDDDIIRTFSARVQHAPGLTWTAFLAEHQPVAQAVTELGIEAEDSHARYGEAIHDDRIPKVVESVKRGKARMPSQVIETDARNLLLVQIMRRLTKADEMGNRVWLVTLDSSLRAAERRLVREGVYSAPSSMRTQVWCSYLSPSLSPENDTLQGYVTHLVQSQLGLLAEDPVFVNTNFLITLQEAPFDSASLLDGDPDKTRRVLVALQEEREVRELLRAPPTDATQAEEWVKRLQEAVGEALAQMSSGADRDDALEAARAERDRALTEVRIYQRERDQTLRRIAELERDMQTLTTSNNAWWSRILARLRGS